MNNTKASAPDVFTTAGDLFVATGADAGARLAKGTDGQILQMIAGAVSWASALWTTLTGGNWKTTYTNGSGAVTELALGAAYQELISTGASAAPAFVNQPLANSLMLLGA